MPAYNYYGQPYGYQPNGYQPMYTPVQQQPVQQQATPVTSGIIWISGEQEASMYPIAPNSAVALWEKTGKTIYLKSADQTGRPTIRIYDLVERAETASGASQAKDDQQHSYVTKNEFATLVDAMKGITGEIETMKGDLYGVAGRKKAVKKQEAEDDA